MNLVKILDLQKQMYRFVVLVPLSPVPLLLLEVDASLFQLSFSVWNEVPWLEMTAEAEKAIFFLYYFSLSDS